MLPAHALMLGYAQLLDVARTEVDRMAKDPEIKADNIDRAIQEWGQKGVLVLEGLTEKEKTFFMLGYFTTLFGRAISEMAAFQSLIANPPQTLAWVAKQKLETLKQAQMAAEAIQKATESSPDWDPAECHMGDCAGGPCQKLCGECAGHCLGHS